MTAQATDFFNVAAGEGGHGRSSVWHPADEPFLLERSESFANGGATDLEAFGNFSFREPLPGLKLPAEDGVAQGLCYAIRKGFAGRRPDQSENGIFRHPKDLWEHGVRSTVDRSTVDLIRMLTNRETPFHSPARFSSG